MSLSQNQSFQDWKVVEDHLRSTVFTCYARPVSGADANTLGQCFTMWALIMRDLCGASRLRSPVRFASWFTQLANYPLEAISTSLKDLAAFIRDYNRDMGPVETLATFKQLHSEMGKLCRLVAEPFSDWLSIFLRDPNPYTFRVVLTCVEFPNRLTLNDLPELEIIEQEKYLELERDQSTWTYSESLLAELREIVQSGLCDLPDMDFSPSHGNGAVSDCRGKDREAKTVCLLADGLTPRLHHYFCQQGLDHPFVDMRKVSRSKSCRVIFVPKGMTSKRVISAEPTCNMWFQHSILRCLDRWLPASYFKVTMHDQSRNMHLAQQGSMYRTFGTIDLSSASDSITHTLVKSLFEGHWLWDALWSCRSTTATVGRTMVKLNKFAPMGSAVCFPVMCIVFSAIVRLAQERVGVSSDFAVYGDDIVCHSSCFNEVLKLLAELHFTVNVKKTFSPDSPFKESCGGEYYYGEDVTPFRIPRFFQGWTSTADVKENPRLFPSWCSLVNRISDCGLCATRAYMVRRLLDVCPTAPFSYSGRYQAIQSYVPTNWHLREKYETERSRIPVYKPNCCRGRIVRAFQARTVTKPGSDDIRYRILLEEYDKTDREALSMPEDLINLRVGPSHPQVGDVWIPEIYLLDKLLDCADTEGSLLMQVSNGTEWRMVIA